MQGLAAAAWPIVTCASEQRIALSPRATGWALGTDGVAEWAPPLSRTGELVEDAGTDGVQRGQALL